MLAELGEIILQTLFWDPASIFVKNIPTLDENGHQVHQTD